MLWKRNLVAWLVLGVCAALPLAAQTTSPARQTASTQKESSPLLVGGSFSSKPNLSVAPVFDQAARDAEVASLNQQIRNKQFVEVVKRINTLTAQNFLDNRFHLLLALAYDGLNK